MAPESLAASEGGPLTERVLRRVRSIERAKTVHIGSDLPGEELFFDTFYVGHLKAHPTGTASSAGRTHFPPPLILSCQ